jgi:hypothetical protein
VPSDDDDDDEHNPTPRHIIKFPTLSLVVNEKKNILIVEKRAKTMC